MASKPLQDASLEPTESWIDRRFRPFRRALAKFLRPMLAKEEELLASLDGRLDQIQQRHAQLVAMMQTIQSEDAAPRLRAFEEKLKRLSVDAA